MKYNRNEEIVLCQAFLKVSEDPIVGTEFKGPKLAEEVMKEYLARISAELPQYVDRTKTRKPENLVRHFKKIVKHLRFWISAHNKARSNLNECCRQDCFH